MNKNILLFVLLIAGGLFFFKKESDNSSKATPAPVVQPESQVLSEEKLDLILLHFQGNVEVNSKPAKEGDAIPTVANITCADNSFAVLAYGKNFSSKIKVGSKSSITLGRFEAGLPTLKEGITAKLTTGSMLLEITTTNKQKQLKILSGSFTLGIREAFFFIKQEDEKAFFTVKTGSIEIESNDKRNALFAYADSGYDLNKDDTYKEISFKDHEIIWNINTNEQLETVIEKNNFARKLDELVFESKNKSVTMKNSASNKKYIYELHMKTTDKEFQDIEIDTGCLLKKMVGCDFISRIFNEDILFRRGDTNGVFPSGLTEGMKDSISKHKTKLTNKGLQLKSEMIESEKDAAEFEEKSQLIDKKMAETKDETTKAEAYKSLVDIFDNSELRNEFNKMK